jgi:hypothetical protein
MTDIIKEQLVAHCEEVALELSELAGAEDWLPYPVIGAAK